VGLDGLVKEDRREFEHPALVRAATSVTATSLRVMKGRLHVQYRPKGAGALACKPSENLEHTRESECAAGAERGVGAPRATARGGPAAFALPRYGEPRRSFSGGGRDEVLRMN
jgi:hypothetical protein